MTRRQKTKAVHREQRERKRRRRNMEGMGRYRPAGFPTSSFDMGFGHMSTLIPLLMKGLLRRRTP